LWGFPFHLHSEFQCESFSLLHDQTVYSKRLLHHSHYSSCNEFEICNWLTVRLSKPVVNSTVLLLQSSSNSCDLCRSERLLSICKIRSSILQCFHYHKKFFVMNLISFLQFW
jgi:hypothetical protein